MKYITTVIIEKDFLKRVNQLLDIDDLNNLTEKEKELRPETDDFISLVSAEFENGNIIDVNVCSGNTNYYDNCILKDKDGHEITCFDCSYSIDNVMEFIYGNDTYIVNLETY